MALVKGADTHHMAETISPVGQNGFRWGYNGLYWVDLDQIDKMAPRKGQISSRAYRAESALWG